MRAVGNPSQSKLCRVFGAVGMLSCILGVLGGDGGDVGVCDVGDGGDAVARKENLHGQELSQSSEQLRHSTCTHHPVVSCHGSTDASHWQAKHSMVVSALTVQKRLGNPNPN